ncbi:hypothetical protein CLOSTMETH_02587 [[Clostridium] methylpentosum DSM 5476]|uniref:Uncharacterized protein n=1 Tax=[Clostridium] methylpentosum DSM 5476 TaxID=537013 RepID=C0EFE5_9FIRM|nr:hypothetical protein CLOSTMETH_02587 [[Clostridium] methylpentosum DSM 5476]
MVYPLIGKTAGSSQAVKLEPQEEAFRMTTTTLDCVSGKVVGLEQLISITTETSFSHKSTATFSWISFMTAMEICWDLISMGLNTIMYLI